MHNERKDEGLLQNGIGENFFLDGHFDLDSAGMGFGPDEGGVDKSDLL